MRWIATRCIQSIFTSVTENLALPHLPRLYIPLPNASTSYIVAIVVLRPTSHQSFAKRNIDSSLLGFSAFPFRNAMQPVCLSTSAHQHHVPTPEGELQRLALDRSSLRRRRDGRAFPGRMRKCREWLVFHQKISLGAQRQGRDGWIQAEEAFVIAMIRDAVCAGSVVIDKAEVIG